MYFQFLSSSSSQTVYTAYPNPMDMAYRLSGRYPFLIFIIVDTAYSLNEYSVFDTSINTAYPGEWIRCIDFLYSIALVFPIFYTGPHERNIDEYWWRIYKSGDLEVLES
ncbi:hypothetical protein Tco_1093907 [Tanacetum coccineum]|uniref:NADH-plastoquinone oxidoreductase subunit 5 n=1 Tax=Tanacetum coccineum TaxID=301880 RepID=A0ABQ5IFE7_9ASTR